MTSEPAEGAVPTLRDRMRAAGLSDERIAFHADANAIAVDGEFAGDLDQPPTPVAAGTSSAVDAPVSTVGL